MLKTVLATFAFSLSCAGAFAQQPFPGGKWMDQDRQVVIQIAPCAPDSKTYCGVIVQDDRAEATQNPANHQAVSDLRQSRGVWRGKISDGGMIFGLTMRAVSSDNASVRMCFAGIACSTETWSRLSNTVSTPALGESQ
jgi:uncharacterized protein (DUF2147 family)